MKKLLAILLIVSTGFFYAFKDSSTKKVILIDVGHGGEDNGATYQGISEKEINLSIAQKLKDLNDNEELEIVLTRENDEFISLQKRVELMKSLKPDVVVSLHSNLAQNANFKGLEVYYSSNSESGSDLAQKLGLGLSKYFNLRNTTSANFFVLKHAPCPAVMLEMGFLSNENDRLRLTSEEGQEEMAKYLLKSLSSVN